jgi:uracil-DNA glycosylase
MSYPFDSGYCTEPFSTLCSEFPSSEGYPQSRFRVEWGPIFHRGRLDGSARILIIGQDPAQHEAIVRRILVGEAGRRVQGFLSKLGITKSYVMINTFLYSVYGSVRTENRRNVQLVGYRNRWLDALLLNNSNSKIEAVVALGKYAMEAWQMWKDTPNGRGRDVVFCSITHPTYPESFSKGDRTKLIESTKRMLQNWNEGLESLAGAITQPDEHKPLALYGEIFTDGEKPEIPLIDYPAGLPAWMRELDGWARRIGETDEKKRRTITITIPKQYLLS